MIPPPGPDDGPDAHVRYEVIVSVQSNGVGGDMCYGYRQDIQAEVEANLGAFGPQDVRFVPGFFADTLQPAGPVAVATPVRLRRPGARPPSAAIRRRPGARPPSAAGFHSR